MSFTIAPEDVQIGEIPLWSSSGQLRYALASTAHGTARKTSNGVQISFSAPVQATLVQEGAGGSYSYSLTFTTETTSASNSTGSSISIEGMRLVVGPNHVQLAGATVNKANAFPEPGRVVYTVLSGTFDAFPVLP